MPVDANGTPSTKLGIYKYNTSGDAPSGKGLNNIVDSLDDIISRLGISGLVANDVPVYDSVAGKWKKAGGTPSSSTYLRGDGTWQTVSTYTPTTYRKTSAKQVVNSIAETDLLNGEITVAAGAMGTDRMLRLTAYGDWKQNSGANTEVPRFKLKLGATTLLDTNVSGGNVVANAVNRLGWRVVCEIMNLGAANAQWATFSGELTSILASGGNSLFVTGEGQLWAIGAVAGYSGVHYNGGGAGAVDTTSAQALALSVILPAASANCDITLKGAIVEVI